VWSKEAKKWSHLKDMRVVELKGTATQREQTLYYGDTQVVVVSLNNLDWLLGGDHGCDGIIIDELSKASGKQARGVTTKGKGECFKYRVGMTATPVSQDFQKLFAMTKLIDGGKALGRNKQDFMNRFFYSDYMGYNWTLRDGAEALIMEKISSLVHAIGDTKVDTLPTITQHVIRFDMPEETREVYNEMKKHMVVGDIEAANEAVKSGKLRQIASGFMYGETTQILDWARYDALLKWVDALDGKPGLVFYEFIQQSWWTTELPEAITLAQINSMSHGVDGLQHEFADILFLQPMWSRDATEQAIGRVWRTGQKNEVNVTTLVCDNTLDDLVMERVEDRGAWMVKFMLHLKG
jgi:hypothetical protein